jgi:Zn-dependent protease/CBS domain-containing protein
MRQGSIKLGRMLGVPLAMDPGVILIGGLLSWLLATLILPRGAPGLVGSVYWSVAIVGALLFLGSLLAHEMAHAIVARRNDVEVEGITLWLFGGFAQFANEPRSAGAEFRISAAGPATSLGVGALFIGAAFGLSAIGVPVVYTTLLGWLGLINGFLGVFNLLPGAPLDGGRILAAALWKLRGDRISGRIGAARTGKAVGMGLAGLGVAEVLFIGGWGGLWTIFIGWFIFNAARTEQVYFVGERALGDLTVRDAMVEHPQSVRTWTTVADLVEGPLRSASSSAVPVLDWNGAPAGIVTMDDVSKVPAEEWSSTEVIQVVRAAGAVPTVAPDQRVADLIEQLAPGSGGYAIVVENGHAIGLIGPDEVRRAIELGKMRPDGSTSSSPPPPPPPVSAPQQRWEPPLHPR